MQCVILAAGEGKRMRPLTSSRPKVMLPLGNRPMMDHLVLAVKEAGIREFIFVVGYGEREIRNYFFDGKPHGVSIRYVTQKKQRGTADALNSARPLVKGQFLLLNGDMLLKPDDIGEFIRQKTPCVGIYHSDHPQDYGVVIENMGMITSLEEKSSHPNSNLINAGAYLFDESVFTILERIQFSPRGELELTDALSEMIESRTLHAYPLQFWMDVGYPWDMLDANEILLADLKPENLGTVEPGVTLQGTVSIGEGSIVKAGTYIEGPCAIGKNCRIGPHAYIRGSSSIGDDCHIGHSVEIKNSIVMAGTKIPHFNYVGDSVIGIWCNFGAGTKIANLRHDHGPVRVAGKDTRRKKFGAIIGDDVQFGINCSVNVGAVIGANTKISPHSFVEGVIGEGSIVK